MLNASLTDPNYMPSPVGFLYVQQASFSGASVKQATALACCPSSSSAAVGTVDGYLYFLDTRDVESLRVITKSFLSESPVKILV